MTPCGYRTWKWERWCHWARECQFLWPSDDFPRRTLPCQTLNPAQFISLHDFYFKCICGKSLEAIAFGMFHPRLCWPEALSALLWRCLDIKTNPESYRRSMRLHPKLSKRWQSNKSRNRSERWLIHYCRTLDSSPDTKKEHYELSTPENTVRSESCLPKRNDSLRAVIRLQKIKTLIVAPRPIGKNGTLFRLTAQILTLLYFVFVLSSESVRKHFSTFLQLSLFLQEKPPNICNCTFTFLVQLNIFEGRKQNTIDHHSNHHMPVWL